MVTTSFDGDSPQSIENLSTRNPGYHIHSESIGAARCYCFNKRFVLSRVQERNDCRILLYFPNLAIACRRCPDFQENVRVTPDRTTRDKRRASLRVAIVRELCFGTRALLDQDTREAFLQQQSCILRCQGDTSFIRK